VVSTPDEVLLKGCVNNDRTAQKQLFEKYSPQMMSICLRYMISRAEAEDLLQEGFIRIFAKISSFKGQSALKTWMSRIFVNMAINKLSRDKNRWNTTQFNEDIYSEYADEEIPSGIDGQRVLDTMKDMPDNYKVVLNMYAIDGLNHQEIADALNISVGGSKSRLSRARSILKVMLKENGLIE